MQINNGGGIIYLLIKGGHIKTYLEAALKVCEENLPVYSSKFSKKSFTQSQIAACLLLRKYLNIDLRTLEKLISHSPVFKNILKLKRIPDHSTFCRHMAKMPEELAGQLNDKTNKFLAGSSAKFILPSSLAGRRHSAGRRAGAGFAHGGSRGREG